MRAFVAIDVPPEAEAVLERLQERMPVGKPTDPETFHITLAFLGEDLEEERVAEMHDGLSALRAPDFEVELRGLSTFGAQHPAVLVADVPRTEALDELQARVASAARRAGIVLERRRFKPHVTLARFRYKVMGPDLERLRRFLEAEARFRLDPWSAGSFALYESVLTGDGAWHEELARYPLVR
ncbi:RNA 2',3'-cyclic phosphodiesterase [Histidinibacterium aquaticum]|uniref:RNA 2',3'-cyclic phosphodiesterase n=1 Tax=Histidinibacterium aquaticum TaxID=2613962 RepID=UPI00168BF896|nr:RNA 2',3'-cyclic phosphodiesterase [Histidinibacterium aquaticum]